MDEHKKSTYNKYWHIEIKPNRSYRIGEQYSNG